MASVSQPLSKLGPKIGAGALVEVADLGGSREKRQFAYRPPAAVDAMVKQTLADNREKLSEFPGERPCSKM
jgi:hypothetical protein